MTSSVTDEKLGGIARQQNDLFRRVREGTLPPDQISMGLQALIEGRFGGAATVPTTSTTFPVTVDYTLPLMEMIKAGRYDWVNPDITEEHFPVKGEGIREVVVELIHFGRFMETDDVLRELDRLDLRPATIEELLALGAKYPEVQREFPVMALGSVWQGPVGYRDAPFLHGDGSERVVFLFWLGYGWRGACISAAVHK